MTASDCPVCDGVLTARGPQSSLVCEDCGRVQNEDDPLEVADTASQQSDTAPEETQHEPTDWVDSVEIADSTDERLVNLLSQLDEAGSVLDAAPDERDRAAEVVINAWEHRLLEGRSVDIAIGACWYITFREQGEPRPIGTVADAVGVSSSELHSFRRIATAELDVSLTVAQPADYLPYLRSQLDLSVATSERAKDLLDNACVTGDPVGIAAGGLYIAAYNLNEAVTMMETAQVACLSKGTIWQRVNDLRSQ